MMKKITWLLGFLAALTLSANATDITLESAAELALGNNRALQAGYSEQRILNRNKRSGWNEFIPDIYVSTGLSRMNQTIPPLDIHDNWNYSVAVGGALSLSASTAYRIGASRLAWEQGLIGIEEFEHSLVRDARKSFLGLLLLRDTLQIYETMVETAEGRYKRAARRFELGDVRKVDMLSYQVAWQNMLPQLTDLKNNFEIRQLEFKRLLGLPEDEEIVLIGEIEAEQQSWDAATLISSRLSRRYDVRSAQKNIQQLENEKGRRISDGLTPALVFNYDYTPTWNGPFADAPKEFDHGELYLGVTMPLDGFIPNSKKSLAIREMSDKLKAAELRLADSLQAGAIEIESAVKNLNKSASTLSSLELNVELASESYDLVSRSYDVGEADYLQVQTADDELNTARIQLVNEKFNYSAALQDLDFAIASTLDVTATPIEEEDTNV
jgi:outer membrane protein TolC